MDRAKEIVIISGKGGTGKTSITASFASLFKDKVMADCDVDAANLHMILSPKKITRQDAFTGGGKATIDPKACTECGICRDTCRFEAISSDYIVNQFFCEGCGACFEFCPSNAIEFTPQTAGHWYVADIGNNKRFVYAELSAGEDNSGKLVALVRNEAKNEAKETNSRLIIIDGPPGIGCPVISSITGTKLVIIVTEPTPTGIHDLERVIALAKHFRIKAAVIINKSDISIPLAKQIRDYCDKEGCDLLGKIPYEPEITEAQKAGKAIITYKPDCEASNAIFNIYNKLKAIIEKL